jgi:hypothetical protein
VAFNGSWWQAGDEEIRAHVTWIAASPAGVRDEALPYTTAYFGHRLVPLLDVLGDEAEVDLEEILPNALTP